MTADLILQRLTHLGHVRIAVTHLEALRTAARAFHEHYPMEWRFAPGTPANLSNYLLAATHGAVHGALAGATLATFLTVVFPPSIIWLGAGAGAVLGAASGVQRVAYGWRVRLVGQHVHVHLLPA